MTSPDRHDVSPGLAGLPLFGEWNQREFDGSPWPMRIFDHETLKYLAVNDAALKLYGYTREEFLAQTARDTRHPDEHSKLVASMSESTGFMRYRGPRRHLKKSGEVIEVEVVTQDVIYDGRLARLAMTIDVTDRIHMQELLFRRQQEFETLAENLPDLIARFDRDHRFLYVNSAVEKLTGKNRWEMIGRTQRELGMPGDLVELFQRSLAEAIDTGDAHLLEFRYPVLEGERLFEAYHVPERDAEGNVATVLCVARDVTERKVAEREQLESRRRLAWILNITGVGTWMNSLPLGKLNWDSRTRELFFVPVGVEPTIELYWQRLHPEDRERARLAVQAAIRDRRLYEIDHRVVNPATGEIRWIRSAGKATYGADGTAFLFDGINYDITDRKKQEEERLAYAMRQRDALVREVHHRIKNSLQGVAGLLRQKVRKHPAIAPGMDEAIAQLQSVALVYGLQETRPDGLIALSEIMNEVCASAEGLTGGTIEKARGRKASRPACVAGSEAVSVAIALNELVFNALKHQTGAGKKRARVTLLESRDSAEIRIANRGKLPKGFNFPAGRGMGDGLGLVRTLLAPPGGEIAFNGGRNEVKVIVKLVPPLLALRQRAIAR